MSAPSWIDQARRGVREVSRKLAPETALTGSNTLWCPACRADQRDRRRGPANIVGEGGWSCKKCDASGDWLDYVCIALEGGAFKAISREARYRVREWFAVQGWCDRWQGKGRSVVPRARRRLRREQSPPPPPQRAPRAELERLWADSAPFGAVQDPRVHEFIERRAYTPWLHYIQHYDLVRILPSGQDPYPRCWPAGRRHSWRVALRAWDAEGKLGSLHARVTTPKGPVFDADTDDEHHGPKTLWPKHPDPTQRYSISGLFFADPSALAIARGAPSPHLLRVFFTEGATDWIAGAGQLGTEPILDTDPEPGFGCNAVFGGVSGSFPTLARLKYPPSLPARPVHFYAALDPDAAGRAYLLQLADGLHPRPLERIPLERWSEQGGDLSAILAAGVPPADLILHAERVDLEQLRAQVEQDRADRRAAREGGDDEPPTPTDPDVPDEDDGDEGIVINVTSKQMAHLVDEAWDAVHKTNDPPRLFLRAGEPVMVKHGDNDVARIASVERTAMQGLLARSARWTRWRKATNAELKHDMDDERRPGYIEAECDQPPTYLAPDLVVFADDWLPRLQGIVASPVYDSSGRLVSTPGYSPDALLWYEPPSGFEAPAIAVAPSDEAVAAARELLCDVWLGDFPFVKPSDKAHAIAVAVLPFVRRLIHSPTPLHLIEASVAGTGKSLLARVLLTVSNGRRPDPVTYTPNDEEMRKAITSYLAGGTPIMFLDDVQGKMASPSLARALSSELWKDRMLGSNATLECTNHATWVATANNLILNTDIARRSVRCRLDRGMQRPWEWKGAKIANLETWTDRHRPKLVAAILTIVQAWLARGRPTYDHNLGSFESWSVVMGGILQTAGIPGFLEDMADLYESADSAMAEWYALIEAWWDAKPDRQYDQWVEATDDKPAHSVQHRCKRLRASELGAFAREQKMLGDVMGDKSERSQNTRLGKALGRLRDRVMEGVRLKIKRGSRGPEYWLERVGETGAERRARQAAESAIAAGGHPQAHAPAPGGAGGALGVHNGEDRLPVEPEPAPEPEPASYHGDQQQGWGWDAPGGGAPRGGDPGYTQDPDEEPDGGW